MAEWPKKILSRLNTVNSNAAIGQRDPGADSEKDNIMPRKYTIIYNFFGGKPPFCFQTRRIFRDGYPKRTTRLEYCSVCMYRGGITHTVYTVHVWRGPRVFMEAAAEWEEPRVPGWENDRGSHPQHHRVWFKFVDLVTRNGSARRRCTEFEVLSTIFTRRSVIFSPFSTLKISLLFRALCSFRIYNLN